MDVALWILQFAGAVAFLMTGSAKLFLARDKLRDMVGWVADLPAPQLKLLGLAEVAGAFGLVLPELLRIYPILSPVAAVALFILMLGAVASHIQRGEAAKMGPALVLGILAALVALGRFFVVPA